MSTSSNGTALVEQWKMGIEREMYWFMMSTEDAASELVCTVPIGKPK